MIAIRTSSCGSRCGRSGSRRTPGSTAIRRDRHGHAFAKDQGPGVLPPQRRHGLPGGLAAQV